VYSHIGNTVISLLEGFDKEDIEYAVLRNYEDLPEIGHDLDMVCNNDQLTKIKFVIDDCAKKLNWEVVEIKLWKSHINDFSIHVFKLIDFERQQCLQLDFFEGHSIWSAPAISAKEFISRRIKERFYFKISVEDEILIRSMQLACAIRDNEQKRVIKLKNLIVKLGGEDIVRASFKQLPVQVSTHFIGENDKEYEGEFKRFKHQYFLKSLSQKPLLIIVRWLERIRFRLNLLTFSIPGVLVFLDNKVLKEKKTEFQKELGRWEKGNIITTSTILLKWNSKSIFSAYNILQKGGIVIIGLPILGVKKTNGLLKHRLLKRLRM